MSRTLILAYGILSYAIFFGVFLYSIAFLGNFYIPNSMDAAPTMAFWPALAINLALLAGFAVQHSVMARPAFKRAWTKIVPEAAERSTYVLFSNLAMIALFVFWQPMGGSVWTVEAEPFRTIIFALYFLGWGVLFYATWLINHFDLFGLRQVWYNFRGTTPPEMTFRVPGMHKWVRHPIYVGWLIIFWATPTMTVAHLVFAVMTTAYIVIAIQFEEKDLVDEFGDDYRDYQKDVGMLLPKVSGPNTPAEA